jgi:hypothetical protein
LMSAFSVPLGLPTAIDMMRLLDPDA